MTGPASLLQLRGVSAGYGEVIAVRELTFEVAKGAAVGLFGRNGAGKSTTLGTITGVLPCRQGSILLDGVDITRMAAHQRVRRGISCVQEGRRVFRQRSVEENLLLGTYALSIRRRERTQAVAAAYGRFPVLEDKRAEPAGQLSGGQQQMLAIAQALMSRPRLLLLDEPSAGLAPAIVGEVFGSIGRLKDEGITILLVEQLIDRALPHVDSYLLLDEGSLVHSGRPGDDEGLRIARDVYLARSAGRPPPAPAEAPPTAAAP